MKNVCVCVCVCVCVWVCMCVCTHVSVYHCPLSYIRMAGHAYPVFSTAEDLSFQCSAGLCMYVFIHLFLTFCAKVRHPLCLPSLTLSPSLRVEGRREAPGPWQCHSPILYAVTLAQVVRATLRQSEGQSK